MKRGDFVSYKRRPEFRGVIVDTWELLSPDSKRASVVWETGTHTSVSLEPTATYNAVDPCDPFPIPSVMRKALNKQRDLALETASKAADRAEFLRTFLAARPVKGKR